MFLCFCLFICLLIKFYCNLNNKIYIIIIKITQSKQMNHSIMIMMIIIIIIISILKSHHQQEIERERERKICSMGIEFHMGLQNIFNLILLGKKQKKGKKIVCVINITLPFTHLVIHPSIHLSIHTDSTFT